MPMGFFSTVMSAAHNYLFYSFSEWKFENLKKMFTVLFVKGAISEVIRPDSSQSGIR